MKKKADEDLRLIFQNTLSEFPAVVSESVSFRQIIPSLQKRRRLNEPSNPKLPNEAAEVLNDKEFHRYGDIFLGSVAEQDNVALLFGHMLVINKAKSAKVCFVDGTFSMTPRMEESKWYQLLIFSVEYLAVLEDPIPDEDQINFDPDNPHLWGISVPAVCALMTSKSEALYKLVFSKIKEVLDFSPVTIMSDFERGLHNALKTTWSESLVNGCRFHFENAITKQLAILSLQREYRHQIQVKKWARKVSALCLLPANKILVAWGSRVIEIEQFSRKIKIKLLAFKRYFESYWLNIVTPEGFSVYGLNHKTNNNAESLNRRLKSNMVDQHRGFWQFMKMLNQHVIVHKIQELQQLACNQPVRRDQRDYGAIEKMRCFEKKL
ncbi:uncharacterized protein LOC124816690 [Hydra vulgaris]|uniref:uncharacterized protein LOC124816690 n=1 Tax=Hydra vulgaris TaxID=6087 RepID=UPI001F5F1753|nr:uncharacterized protein LOC124816690 [Hydra vulgaris]